IWRRPIPLWSIRAAFQCVALSIIRNPTLRLEDQRSGLRDSHFVNDLPAGQSLNGRMGIVFSGRIGYGRLRVEIDGELYPAVRLRRVVRADLRAELVALRGEVFTVSFDSRDLGH